MQIPQPWVLSIDRTTWEFGQCCYNILTIGIVHEGVAFPVLWWMLKKKGNLLNVNYFGRIASIRLTGVDH